MTCSLVILLKSEKIITVFSMMIAASILIVLSFSDEPGIVSLAGKTKERRCSAFLGFGFGPGWHLRMISWKSARPIRRMLPSKPK